MGGDVEVCGPNESLQLTGVSSSAVFVPQLAAAGHAQMRALSLLALACCFGSGDSATEEEQAACAAAYISYLAAHAELIEDCPLGTGSEGPYRSKCPRGMQRTIDAVYADCGGLVVEWDGTVGIDWDAEMGDRIKYNVEKCGCAHGLATAPSLAPFAICVVAAASSVRLRGAWI